MRRWNKHIPQTAAFCLQSCHPGNEAYSCRKHETESSTSRNDILKMIFPLGEWSEICVFVQGLTNMGMVLSCVQLTRFRGLLSRQRSLQVAQYYHGPKSGLILTALHMCCRSHMNMCTAVNAGSTSCSCVSWWNSWRDLLSSSCKDLKL